jgi:hypothetical protein
MGRSSVSPLAALALCAFTIASVVPSSNAFAIEIAFNETECFSKYIEDARDFDHSRASRFRVMGAYVVSKDPHKYYESQKGERNLAVVQVEVKQPDGTIVHREEDGKSRSEFDVGGRGVGTYSICFTNAGTKGKRAWFSALPHQKSRQQLPAHVRVHYFQPVHEDDEVAVAEVRAKSPKNTREGDASVPRKAAAEGNARGDSSSTKAFSAGHASEINALALNLQDEVSLMRQELFYLKARAGRHKKTADSNARRTLWWTVAEVVTLCAVAAAQVLAVTYFFNKDQHGEAAGRGSRPGTMYGGSRDAFGSGAGFGGFAAAAGGGGGYSDASRGSGWYGQSAQPGGVLPPFPGQGSGSSYEYGGQSQVLGGGSVYGNNQDGLRGRGYR